MVILPTLLLFTEASLDLQFDESLSTAGRMVIFALVVFGAAITVVLLVARLRRFVLHWAKQLLTESAAAVRFRIAPSSSWAR